MYCDFKHHSGPRFTCKACSRLIAAISSFKGHSQSYAVSWNLYSTLGFSPPRANDCIFSLLIRREGEGKREGKREIRESVRESSCFTFRICHFMPVASWNLCYKHVKLNYKIHPLDHRFSPYSFHILCTLTHKVPFRGTDSETPGTWLAEQMLPFKG